MKSTELIIATPTDGHPETASVKWGYMNARERLIRGGALTIPATLGFADDLSRARSRMASYALRQPGWKWLLWWDDDNVPHDPELVPNMLTCAIRNGLEVLAAPYPRKRMPVTMCHLPLEEDMRAGQMRVVDNHAEIRACGFGFVLTSRHCLERMTEHYAAEWFTDLRQDGPSSEVVALFKQVHTETIHVNGHRFRDLMSEDHSFCWRWREMGGKIHLYLGPGTPVAHVGPFSYGQVF